MAVQTRWIRPIRILGIALLINAPISGVLIWRDQGQLAGIIVIASHVLVGVYCVAVIPHFLRLAAARERGSTGGS